jgi:hypothetical protein
MREPSGILLSMVHDILEAAGFALVLLAIVATAGVLLVVFLI